MPIPRRRSDPAELAAVLRRLEGLRIGAPAATDAPPDAEAVAAPPALGALPTEPATIAEPPMPGLPMGEPPMFEPRVVGQQGPASVWRHGRFDPGRRGLALLAVLALLGACGGAWYFVAAGSSGAAVGAVSPSARVDVSPLPASLPPELASGWPTASVPPTPSASPIVVYVVGKVAAPGVVELPAGARIHDAIDAAGGALAGTDLTALDLASRLHDGQQVFVGIPPPTGAAAQAGGGVVGGDDAPVNVPVGGGDPSGPVNLNTASVQQLQALPGVGPVLAQHILDWRSRHGAFTSVSQLQQVSGIGPAKYAALVDHVRV